MLIYSKKDLYNKMVQKQSADAFLNKNLSKEAYTNILAAHPSALYTPDYFIRIALGALTFVAVIFSALLLTLIFFTSAFKGVSGLFFFFGLITYGSLEFLVKRKQYYNAGVDNLLMFFSAVSIVSAFVAKDSYDQNITVSAIAFAVCLLLSLRFADGFMSGLSFLALFVFVFLLYIQTAKIIAAAPFFMMIFSVVVYRFVKKTSKNEKLFYYRYCCQCVLLLTLLAFYASANYLVVQKTSAEMFNLQYPAYDDGVSFGWLFWILTFLIPPAYVLYGIVKKHIMFIRSGLVLIGVSVFTFRYYYSILPTEIAMLIGGAVLVLVSYLLIKYLAIPRLGFSFNKKEFADKERIDLKALIIAQVAGKRTNADKGVEFGSGSFGSGGAGGNY